MRIIRTVELPMQAQDELAPAATGRLTIDLAALVANWRRLAALSEGAECSGVVKADAYGTGLEAAGKALAGAGCRSFFVANVAEGVRLRAVAPQATIYVLEGLAPGAAGQCLAAGLRPVLGSLAEIDEWAARGRAVGRKLEAAVHIDTGMNRMGAPPQQAAEAARRAEGVAVTLAMSHLACAQWPDHALTRRQIETFSAVRALFPLAPASLCNSSGIFLPDAPLFEMVRPGYALYGGNPTPGRDNPMRRVVTLEATILAVRDIAPGESVGYDSSWIATRPTRLATLGVGYADGVPVSASGHGDKPAAEAIVGGRPCPFVGRVSMDFVVLDVTDAPPDAVRRGAAAEIIGETISVDALASRAGTIGYEILTRLGPRYERRYL